MTGSSLRGRVPSVEPTHHHSPWSSGNQAPALPFGICSEPVVSLFSSVDSIQKVIEILNIGKRDVFGYLVWKTKEKQNHSRFPGTKLPLFICFALLPDTLSSEPWQLWGCSFSVQKHGHGARISGFKSWLYHFITVWWCTSYLTSLYLDFRSCKIGLKKVPT